MTGLGNVVDPIKFGKVLWPGVTMYKEQRLIINSVVHNGITVVPAANMMGDVPPL